MNAAGAQFDHTDIDAAVRTVEDVIENMLEKGDL